MITVLPSRDRDEISGLFKKHGLDTTCNSGCVIAHCGQEQIGYCIYELDEKSITVLELEPKQDLALADGVLRSALHVAAERSAMDARFSDTAPIQIFERLGFVKNKEERTLDINKLFISCCSCEK